MTEEKIAELDHLLIEALRAAEMRQGCTNHSYYADILKGQILDYLADGVLGDEEIQEFADKFIKDNGIEALEFAKVLVQEQRIRDQAEKGEAVKQEKSKFIRWGEGKCPHSTERYKTKRHNCFKCWAEFKSKYIKGGK